jgi:hypothetical protein
LHGLFASVLCWRWLKDSVADWCFFCGYVQGGRQPTDGTLIVENVLTCTLCCAAPLVSVAVLHTLVSVAAPSFLGIEVAVMLKAVAILLVTCLS